MAGTGVLTQGWQHILEVFRNAAWGGRGGAEDCARHQGERSEEMKCILVTVEVLLALGGQGPEAKCGAITG